MSPHHKLYALQLEPEKFVSFGGGVQYLYNSEQQIVQMQKSLVQTETPNYFLKQMVSFRKQWYFVDSGVLYRYVAPRNSIKVVSPIVCRVNNYCLAHCCGDLRIVDVKHQVSRV